MAKAKKKMGLTARRPSKTRDSDEFPAELNAVALLLCAPSKLNRAWRTCGDDRLDSVIDEQLDALPFSPSVRKRAVKVMRVLKDQRTAFAKVTNLLDKFLWDGQIPHPGEPLAKKIITFLKRQPPER